MSSKQHPIKGINMEEIGRQFDLINPQKLRLQSTVKLEIPTSEDDEKQKQLVCRKKPSPAPIINQLAEQSLTAKEQLQTKEKELKTAILTQLALIDQITELTEQLKENHEYIDAIRKEIAQITSTIESANHEPSVNITVTISHEIVSDADLDFTGYDKKTLELIYNEKLNDVSISDIMTLAKLKAAEANMDSSTKTKITFESKNLEEIYNEI